MRLALAALLFACGSDVVEPVERVVVRDECCECLTTIRDGGCTDTDPGECLDGPTIHTSCECLAECASECGNGCME